MRRSLFWTFFAGLSLLGSGTTHADETADKIAAQKKTAEANWAQLEGGELGTAETTHLLLFAPKAMEKRLKELGISLEKHYATARKALDFDAKREPWEGKLTVYLLADREQFTAFIRRIERRRLEAEEAGSYSVDQDPAHVAASPPRSKIDPPVEIQAAEQIASALLARRAGKQVEVPAWVVAGFGRATVWRSNPTAYGKERSQAAGLVGKNKSTAMDVWGNTLAATDATLLRASLVDYMAYGSYAAKFPAFIEGFRPEENQTNRTTAQALEAAGITAGRLDQTWRNWLPGR